jgi:hypothetical protein
MPTAAADRSWPTLLRELSDGERLIVASFRRWIAGWVNDDPTQWRIVSREFTEIFGTTAAKAALASLGRLINVLRLNACRTIEYHQPCCPCLGVDEACLVVLVASCQSGAPRLARAASSWFVVEDAVGDLLSGAILLADAMRRRGLILPDRPRAAMPFEPDAPLPLRAVLH